MIEILVATLLLIVCWFIGIRPLPLFYWLGVAAMAISSCMRIITASDYDKDTVTAALIIQILGAFAVFGSVAVAVLRDPHPASESSSSEASSRGVMPGKIAARARVRRRLRARDKASDESDA